MNSSPFTQDELGGKTTPSLPNIHYYNKQGKNTDNNEQKFINNMTTQCKISSSDCLNGKCDQFTDDLYSNTYGKFANGSIIPSLSEDIRNSIGVDANKNKNKIINQIQYLTCQVARARARKYDSDKLNISYSDMSFKDIFNKFPNLKISLIIIFFITIYLLFYGIASSIDVVFNILDINNNGGGTNYNIGFFLGLVILFGIIYYYSNNICKTIEPKYDITTNTTGKEVSSNTTVNNDARSSFVLLSVVIICITLFLKHTDTFPDKNFLYYALVCGCYLILFLVIYFYYTIIPGLISPNYNDKEENIKIFINQQEDVSKITSNKDIDTKEKANTLYKIILGYIFVCAALFFYLKRTGDNSSLLAGLCSGPSLLVLPILWIFNYIIAIKYFYIYPIGIIIMRFIRYAGMVILYMITEAKPDLKDTFSDNLLQELDDIRNYTPSWSLFGVSLLKTIMNTSGFTNEFSEKFTNNNNSKKNISADKYFSSLIFLRLILNKDISDNKTRWIMFGTIMFISLFFSYIYLVHYAKIFTTEDVKETSTGSS
jgi:hypothetical protein